MCDALVILAIFWFMREMAGSVRISTEFLELECHPGPAQAMNQLQFEWQTLSGYSAVFLKSEKSS